MKCPQCQNEIPETGEAVQLCPFCGSSVNTFYAVQPDPALVRPEYPMKWYKFLIYFSLFASAVLNALSGITQMLGTVYGDAQTIAAVYKTFPALRPVDIVYGILLIAVAVFAIYTRQQLAHYRSNGPTCLYALYGATMALSVIYLVIVSIVIKDATFTATVVSQSMPGLISSAVVLALNIVYFRKRKALF